MTSDVCKPDESRDDVTCDSRFVNRIVLHLGDGDDRLFTDIPWWMPAMSYTVYSGPGDDVIGGNGGGYADRLFGGAGDDRLTGYSMAGGPGDDHFWTKDATKDFVLGGPGSDTADAEPDDVLTGVETRSGG